MSSRVGRQQAVRFADAPQHSAPTGSSSTNNQIITPPKKKQNESLKKHKALRNATFKPKKSVNKEMLIEKKESDEVVLIFSVFGSCQHIQETGEHVVVPVTDALQWLQDLQRVLRRDKDDYRPIQLKLGEFNAVGTKLLPLVMACRNDDEMVLTLMKILCILTKPMSDAAKKAGRLVIDSKSGKVPDGVLNEQKTLRDNAIKQSELLMDIKKTFVKHCSNRGQSVYQKKAKNGDDPVLGLFGIFDGLLAGAMSRSGSARTSRDNHRIELVLNLVNNLLQIQPLNRYGNTEKSQVAAQLQRELIVVFHEQGTLEFIRNISQNMEARENKLLNLTILEIMTHLLGGQDPTDVAMSAFKTTQSNLSAPVNVAAKGKAKTRIVRTTTTSKANMRTSTGNSLKAHLQTERNKLQLSASSRHSHFGGTLMITNPSGNQKYVSASDYLIKKDKAKASSASGSGKKPGESANSNAGIAAPTRRKNKKTEVFIGSGRSSSAHTRPGASAADNQDIPSPAQKKALRALNSFCELFMAKCYGPVMKSLKNEFRTDSSRLEDGDRVRFFRLLWFFHQWARVRREQRQKVENEKGNKKAASKLTKSTEGKESKGQYEEFIFTMDVFMFNLVLNSTDEFLEHKKPAALAHTVALLNELMHMLHACYESTDDTENTMALGIMDRLYYSAEPLDRLPRLLSKWAPGMFSREYLCDLIELTHTTWKLLDVNIKRCIESTEGKELKRPKDAAERFKMATLELDKDHYFMRKYVSNQMVFMYTQLLSQYDVNAAQINRRIVAYLIRLCKFTIKPSGEGAEVEVDDTMGENQLAAKQATLEPMLYNIGLFKVLDTVLNDMTIRDMPDFESLLMFSSSLTRRFALAAEVNPMLYVEALFKHPIPHRFCELSSNLYVNEELRMIAVRDLLLEDQKRYEQQEDDVDSENEKETDVTKAAGEKTAAGYDDEEEEELEFNGDDEDMETEGLVSKKRRRKSKKKRKSKSKAIMSEDEEQNDDESEKEADFEEEEVEAKEDSQEDDMLSSEPDKSLDANEAASPKETSADDERSPKLSGKKRLRKSLGGALEDSDDEDFGAAAPVAKAPKRVIFDDDDDEDDE